jgi:excisionase family DNA binding protein
MSSIMERGEPYLHPDEMATEPETGARSANPPAGGDVGINVEPLLLSVSETAAMLGIHRTTVYDLMASGRLRSATLGRRRLIPRTAIDAFVAALDERAE